MTPQQLSKSDTEHAHQRAFIATLIYAEINNWEAMFVWAKIQPPAHRLLHPSYLKWVHAIANGGSRGDSVKTRMQEGAKLKAEGVKPGVLDVSVPLPNLGFAGCYIEFKKPAEKKANNPLAGLSKEQKEFREYALAVGYQVYVCYSWEEGLKSIFEYYKVNVC